MKELDAVVLTRDIPSERLAAGDLGTIVHVHDDNHFEVEFVESTGPSRSSPSSVPPSDPLLPARCCTPAFSSGDSAA